MNPTLRVQNQWYSITMPLNSVGELAQVKQMKYTVLSLFVFHFLNEKLLSNYSYSQKTLVYNFLHEI